MSRDVKINIGTTADTSGVDKAKAAIQGLGSEAKQTSSAIAQVGTSSNAASRDVATLDAAIDKLRARRRAMIETGPQGDSDGFRRRAGALNTAIDRLQSRRASTSQADPTIDDLATSTGSDFNGPARRAANGAGQMSNRLENLSAVLSQATFAVAAGVAIGNEIQENWFNWASSLAAGGLSTEADQRAAQTAISEQGKLISDFYRRAKELNSIDDKDALLTAARELQNQLLGQRAALGVNETSQRKAIDDSIAQIGAFYTQALTIDVAVLAEARAKAQAAQQLALDRELDAQNRAAFSDSLTALKNRASLAALKPEDQRQAIAASLAQQQQIADSPVGGNFTNADRAAARKEILSLTSNLQRVEAQITAEKEKQAAAEAEQKARTAAATGDLQNQLTIARYRAAGNEAAADKAEMILRVEEELAQLRKAGVTDEALLADYSTTRKAVFERERSAKREALDIETRINEARATGNKEEEAKLKWIQDYNRLKAQGFTDEEARRSVNAEMASKEKKSGGAEPSAYVPPGAQVGDLFSGTNRRRGSSESDAFGESALNLPPGGSLLDQYKANQSRPVGSINGQSILGADPKSSGGNNAQGVAAAAEAFKESADLAPVADGINAALDKLASATDQKTQDIAALKTGLKNCEAKIYALAHKIS